MPQPQHEAHARLGEFARSLTVAWKNLAAYPPGHPVLSGTVENALGRLAALTAPDEPLVLGISRKGLILRDTRLESPQAERLGQALFQRQVAILRIDHEVEAAELETFLRLLAGLPSQAGVSSGEAEIPLWEELAAAGVQHIRLQPVEYGSMRVTDEIRTAPSGEPLWDSMMQTLLAWQHLSAEPGSLWQDIFRTLLPDGAAGEGVADASPERAAPADLTRLIADHLWQTAMGGIPAGRGGGAGASPSEPAEGGGPSPGPEGASAVETGAPAADPGSPGPPSPVGGGAARKLASLLGEKLAGAVGSHLATARGGARQVALQQTAELVRSLPEEMRQSALNAVIRALAPDEGAGEAMEFVSSSFSPDAILSALRMLRTEGVQLSPHAMRLANALASVPGPTPETDLGAPPDPPAHLLSEMLVLFRNEDIDRFNPEDQKALFERLAVEMPVAAPLAGGTPADLGDRIDSLADDVLAGHFAVTLLEMLGRNRNRDGAVALLARLEQLFRHFLTRAQLEQATTIIETIGALGADPELDPELRTAVGASLERLASWDTLAALVESLAQLPPAAAVLVKPLIDRLGAVAIRSFLFALTEEPNRARRRRIFDLLASLGSGIVPDAAPLLADHRWYVVRNMTALLRAVDDRASLDDVRRLFDHADPRVRVEALRSLLTLDSDLSPEFLGSAIGAADPKLAETAITLAGKHGLTAAIEPLVRLLVKWDLFGRQRSLRLKALRALGDLADPAILPRLDRFFRNWPLPVVAVEERRAAFESLRSYPEPVRRPLVQKGLRSGDPAIRETCRRLAGSGRSRTSTRAEANP